MVELSIPGLEVKSAGEKSGESREMEDSIIYGWSLVVGFSLLPVLHEAACFWRVMCSSIRMRAVRLALLLGITIVSMTRISFRAYRIRF